MACTLGIDTGDRMYRCLPSTTAEGCDRLPPRTTLWCLHAAGSAIAEALSGEVHDSPNPLAQDLFAAVRGQLYLVEAW